VVWYGHPLEGHLLRVLEERVRPPNVLEKRTNDKFSVLKQAKEVVVTKLNFNCFGMPIHMGVATRRYTRM
jgi:hypothetical protein